jgi:hypothetical protein
VRLTGWEARLLEVLTSAEHRAFEWGVWDCTVFANECVKAVSGQDLSLGIQYSDKLGAARAIREAGYKTLKHYLTEKLGAPLPAVFARRGDVVYETGRVGVCDRDAVFVGQYGKREGLFRVPLKSVECCWRV